MEKRRKVESESEARRCLAALESSGLSLSDWARGQGIDGRSLHAWKMNLERWHPSAPVPSAGTARGQLVEIVAAPESPRSRYVVHVGGASVELGDDFDDESVRRLVAVLRSC